MEYNDKVKNIISSLLLEAGITNKFEVVSLAGEGKELPNGIESESGWILLDDGRAFMYWLDWDENKTAPDGNMGYYTLGNNETFESDGNQVKYFSEITPDEGDLSNVVARKRLDLPLSEKQKEALQKALEDNPELQEELKS